MRLKEFLHTKVDFTIAGGPRMKGDDISSLPLLCSQSSRISGTIKKRPEDFQVTEIPLYDMEGEGPHLYMKLTKHALTTDRALRVLSNHFNVPKKRFGVAGRKDKKALTTQYISLEHANPDDVRSFNHDKIELNVVDWHRNKLRRGHLSGNEFRIKVRELSGNSPEEFIETNLRKIESIGLPNYFGHQRFGRRNDTALLGKNLLHNELEEFVRNYFGKPKQADPPHVRKARQRFEDDQYEQAMDFWPKKYNDKRCALAAFIDRRSPGPVLSAITKSKRQLFVSAYQSQVFNEILGERIPEIDTVYEGDIAKKTDTGGLFEVEAPDTEQPRADNFEISATGLLPGLDPWRANGKPGTIEEKILGNHNLTAEKFEKVGYLHVDGSRRALRVQPTGIEYTFETDQHGPLCELVFTLPSGSYATIFLRELLRAEHILTS